MEKPRGPRAIGIPAAPDAFAVALVANEKTLESGVIQTQRAPRAQGFDGLDEHQIRGAGAVAWRRLIRHHGKNARLKMGGGLEPDVFSRCDLSVAQINRAEKEDEADDDSRRDVFQNYGS